MDRWSLKGLVAAGVALALQLGAPAQAQAQAQRLGQPKVAVYNFSDPTGSGLGPQLRDMIRTAIVNTKKFSVFSRDFSSAEEEAQLRRAGKVTRNASNSSVQGEAVDYAIEGSITSVQSGAQTDSTGTTIGIIIGVPLSGCSKQLVSVGIDVTVKHLGTQETPYATSLTKSVQSKCTQSGGAVDVPVLMRQISEELAFNFTTQIYPMKVIVTQPDGGLILNYGSPFLAAGTYVKLFGPTTETQDGGRIYKIPGPPLGRALVVDANAETARAMVEGGAIAPIPAGSIARIDDNQAPAKPAKRKRS